MKNRAKLFADIVEILRKNGMQFGKHQSATEIIELFHKLIRNNLTQDPYNKSVIYGNINEIIEQNT